MTNRKRTQRVCIVLVLGAFLAVKAGACTRALYVGDDGTVIVGRSIDWKEDMHTNLWVFPKGIARDDAAGENSPHWTSKCGSLIAAGYDIGTADGMNEKGLVANILYLDESDYGQPDPRRQHLAISLWGQYVLDNFATVTEAVTALESEPFQIITAELPNGARAQLHLSISDPSGDSAVLEYVAGKLVVHHGKQYNVMTNSPTYDQQLSLNDYWRQIGGLVFLPGTNRAADRFARASFLIQAIPKTADPAYIRGVPKQSYQYQAVASVLGVIRAVSVPLGIMIPGQPNISSAIWRVVADETHKVYYFDSATLPNTFWVSLDNLDLNPGAPVLKLPLAEAQVYAGEVSGQFRPTASFTFMEANFGQAHQALLKALDKAARFVQALAGMLEVWCRLTGKGAVCVSD
jgi:penicillin V acylase-like amidase (Ntn superfamily)